MSDEEDKKLRELVSRGLAALKFVVDEKTATLTRHETLIEELRDKAQEHSQAIAVLKALWAERSDKKEDITAKFLVENNKHEAERTKAQTQMLVALITGAFGLLTAIASLLITLLMK